MRTNYYFLASALPELQIGVPPELNWQELEFLISVNLNKNDEESVHRLRLFYDIQNLRLLWRNEAISDRGNFDENGLEEAILTKEGLPDYVNAFAARYESPDERVEHFSSLLSSYFQVEVPKSIGFLHDYLTFEREWRLVLIGFRAKRLNRDLLKELQYEDLSDDLVMQILAQKDTQTFEPPRRYEELAPLFEEHYDYPLQLYQALCEYRFQKINELIGVNMFTIDRILGYMVQLIIVEKLFELDRKKGIEIVDTIVKEAS